MRLLPKIQNADSVKIVSNDYLKAGLFSAVVTAFVVESHKTLLADPQDKMVNLLTHIANRLDDNGSTLPPLETHPTPPFSPPPSSVRINIFWFCSLILSLTTVLTGTVMIQWLREHQRYPEPPQPKRDFALFQMKSEALAKWHVPEIFTLLPLFLQLALVLFFAGVMEFLNNICRKVAIPVFILMSLILLFLLATIVLPALQAVPTSNLFSKRNRKPPSPCPYKSPQSLAFRTISFPFIRLGILAIDSIQRFLGFKGNDHISPHVQLVKQTLDNGDRKGWVQYDLSWLVLRDVYFKLGLGEDEGFDSLVEVPVATDGPPLYDLTNGLTSLTREVDAVPFIINAYHCCLDISRSLLLFPDDRPPRSYTGLHKRQKHAYFRSLLKLGFNFHPINWLFSDALETPSFDFLIEDTLLGFLVAATQELPGRFRVQLQDHIGELELRISEYIYSQRGEPTNIVQANSITAPSRPSLSEGDKGENQPSNPSDDIRLPCPRTRDPGLSSSNTPFSQDENNALSRQGTNDGAMGPISLHPSRQGVN